MQFVNKIIGIAFLALISGCASVNIDREPKKTFLYEEKIQSVPFTSCYKDRRTGSNICNTFNNDIKTIVFEVSIGRVSGSNDCALTFHGQINHQTKNAFMQAIEAMKDYKCDKKIVILSSNGGLVSEAIEMGIAIRKNEYITLFDGKKGKGNRCASSCTILFIAGIERIATENSLPIFSGQMGFHQWRDNLLMGGMCSNISNMKSRLTRYAEVMLPRQAAEKFVEITLLTECKDVMNYSAVELYQFGISTAKSM
jgi:hypothetical protein